MNYTRPTIYNQGPSDDLTGEAAQEKNMRISAALWHQFGMVMAHPDWLTNWEDQALIKAIAVGLHGKRAGE